MLHCTRDVKTDLGSFKAGDVVELGQDAEAWLLRDSGAFQVVAVDVTAPEEPEQHKAILKPRRGSK